MRISRRGFLGSAAGALILAACGPAQGGPGAAGGQAGGAGPKRGGVIAFHIPVDPVDWDVSLSGKSLDNGQNGHNLASEGLLTYKHGPGVAYDAAILVPSLAESWEMSPDARVFTFHLRRGLKWPDLPPVNGRAFTSEDVKFSYAYQARFGDEFQRSDLPPGTYAYYFEGMEGIDTPDPYTVVVRFANPFPPFPYYAASGWNPIMAHEIYERDGNFSNQILGMGPWQLDVSASQAGSRFVWKRNSNYRDPALPYIDEVRYLIVKDDATAAAAFQTGQTDALINGLSTQTYREIKQKTGAVGYAYFGPVADWRLYVNTRRGPLSDVRVRQALSMGIDRDNFLSTIGQGDYRLALEGVQPGLFTEEEIRAMLPYDPSRAKQLLAEAGYAGGVDLEMTYPGNAYGDIYITALQLLQSQLKPIGININLRSEDKGDWNAKRRAGDYTLGLQQNNSVEADMDSFVFGSWYSKSKSNYNGINDPKVDDLAQAQRQEADPDARREILRELVSYVMQNAYSIPIGNTAKYELWSPSVKNYAPAAYTKGVVITDVWLDR